MVVNSFIIGGRKSGGVGLKTGNHLPDPPVEVLVQSCSNNNTLLLKFADHRCCLHLLE